MNEIGILDQAGRIGLSLAGVLVLLAALWGGAGWLRRHGAGFAAQAARRRLRVIDVAWFRAGSGCALLEVDGETFLVGIGAVGAPLRVGRASGGDGADDGAR